MKTYFIMGKNCLKEVLTAKPEQVAEIYTTKITDPILTKAKKLQLPIKEMHKQQLNQLVRSQSHQGFVAQMKKRKTLSLKQFLEYCGSCSEALVVMCDRISDPQNLGAILRAIECFGAQGMIISKNRGVGITPVVSKASVGASELVPITFVSNLADTVRRFQKEDFVAITAEAKVKAKPLPSFSFPKKSLLIFGAEGEGVQPLISRSADLAVQIPLMGQIDSINVSQAAAVFLSHWRHATSL